MRAMRMLPVVVACVTVAAVALGGCAQTGPGNSEPRQIARAGVEQLLHDVAFDRNNDIGFVARSVATLTATSAIQLIAIDEATPAALGDTFGTLDLLVPESQTVDNAGAGRSAGPFCFRVAFNYYGATVAGDVVETTDVDCPDDAAAVTPPADTTVYPVIPENARESVRAVLTQIAADASTPSTDEIAARIVELLTPPASDFQSLAQPDVVENAGRIGVALQDSDECLLVQLADGVVTDVYPPAVLLQPGELGCSAGTAIADADQLQSPH